MLTLGSLLNFECLSVRGMRCLFKADCCAKTTAFHLRSGAGTDSSLCAVKKVVLLLGCSKKFKSSFMGHPYCLAGVVLTYQPCAVSAAEEYKARLIIYHNQSAQHSRCMGKLYINSIYKKYIFHILKWRKYMLTSFFDEECWVNRSSICWMSFRGLHFFHIFA